MYKKKEIFPILKVICTIKKKSIKKQITVEAIAAIVVEKVIVV